MNTTELIAQVRKDVFIGDTVFPDYDDDAILRELNRTLRTMFGREITNARQGYWQQFDYFTVAQGSPAYPIPDRAVNGLLEQVAISSGGKYYKLAEVTESHAQDYENQVGQLGTPQKYCVRGSYVTLLPSPDQAYTLRMAYYLKPSLLVEPVADGLIQAIDPVALELQVDAIPADLDPSSGTLDIVHDGGWYEVVYPSVEYSAVGNLITLSANDPRLADLAKLTTQGGTGSPTYYVRAENTTEWPPLPEDFHGTLAKMTAVTIMTQLNILDKKAVTEQAAAIEFAEFREMLKPRVKSEAEVLKAPLSVLLVGRSRRGFYGWRS